MGTVVRLDSDSARLAWPHHHHRARNQYVVRVQLTVPGETLSPGASLTRIMPTPTCMSLFVMRSIPSAANWRNYSRRRRGQVKSHGTPMHGRVVELHPDEDFGRIETSDGRLVYFHRGSVIGADFDALAIGVEVRFDEEMGEFGPQSTAVHVIGKHHTAG